MERVQFTAKRFFTRLQRDLTLRDGSVIPAGTMIAWQPMTNAGLIEMNGQSLEAAMRYQEWISAETARMTAETQLIQHRMAVWAIGNGYEPEFGQATAGE